MFARLNYRFEEGSISFRHVSFEVFVNENANRIYLGFRQFEVLLSVVDTFMRIFIIT